MVAAADVIRIKAPLDSPLFLARHLLLLKEVAQSLDVVQREAEGSGINVKNSAGMSGKLRPSRVDYLKLLHRYLGHYVE